MHACCSSRGKTANANDMIHSASLHTHRYFRKVYGGRRGADKGQPVPPLPHELQGRVRLGKPLPIRLEARVGQAEALVGSYLEQDPIMGSPRCMRRYDNSGQAVGYWAGLPTSCSWREVGLLPWHTSHG